MARSYSEGHTAEEVRRARTPRDRELAMATMKRHAERAYARALATGQKREGQVFLNAAMQVVEHENPAYFGAIERLKHLPVTIDEFATSKEFMGDQVEIWPKLLDDIRTMNPDVVAGAPAVHEALLGGATGTGKTVLSDATNKYQIYLTSCFREPQRLFNLSAVTPLVFLFASVSITVTKRVIYTPFRKSFLAMPYVQRWMSYDKHKEGELHLDGNIIVTPQLANLETILGQAIPGGLLDEVNFMTVVESSKKVPGLAGQGGRYDQAEIIYRNLSRRRKRSFLTKGVSIGCICVVSSTRYQGDFLDRRIDEVAKFEERNIFWSRRKQYEVAPAGRYSGEKFRLLMGTDNYPPRVLTDADVAGVHYPEDAEIEEVPVELKVDFQRDPEAAARDYMGRASKSLSPFISQRHRIVDAVLRGREVGVKSFLEKDNVVLGVDGMPQIVEAALPPMEARKQARWVHVDLSRTSDRAGIAMTRVDGLVPVLNPRTPDLVEMLPDYVVEMAATIQPDTAHPLDPSDVRQWIMQLVNFYGFNIEQVSYDGFDSRESITLLRKAGIRATELSLDRTSEGYKVFRTALYDGRVALPDNDILRGELASLEHHKESDKVDHPPKGSKDAADGVCGSVFAASRSPLARQGAIALDLQGNPVVSASTSQRPEGRMRPQGAPQRRR